MTSARIGFITHDHYAFVGIVGVLNAKCKERMRPEEQHYQTLLKSNAGEAAGFGKVSGVRWAGLNEVAEGVSPSSHAPPF